MYDLRFSKSSEKYFKKLKDKELKEKYHNVINKIATDPYIGEHKAGDLAGVYCLDFYYNRVNHEVAYRIYEDGEKIVVVILAGTRENFYNELKDILLHTEFH